MPFTIPNSKAKTHRITPRITIIFHYTSATHLVASYSSSSIIGTSSPAPVAAMIPARKLLHC
jgi:hypothetical protein